MMIIDTDSHVVEPPDLWTSRMSRRKWGDSIPQVRWDDASQMEAWYVGDQRIANAWSAAPATVSGAGKRPAARLGSLSPPTRPPCRSTAR